MSTAKTTLGTTAKPATVTPAASNNGIIKPLVAVAVVVGLDKFYLKNQNLNSSLMFGASVGGGILIASMIGSSLPSLIPKITSNMVDVKTLQARIVEISIGTGAAYALNTYILKNEYNRNDMITKLGVIVAADVISELIDDYMNVRPLSYLV